MGRMGGTNSGLGGFMSGNSIRFSKLKGGCGGADAWRESLMNNPAFARGGGSNRPRTTGTQLPKLHSIHSGTVVSMQPFGAFVQLGKGDTYKDGLLHVSCMGETRVESPEEAGLDIGMALWVKVSELKDEEGKYSLDMRYVSQRDGADLDRYQTKGRVPDNFFQGKNVRGRREPSPAQDAQPPQEQDVHPPTASKRKRAEESDSSSGTEDPEEQAKIHKKLEKARKKLEKLRGKAAKARKRLEKDPKKKKKKGKNKSSSSESSASSAAPGPP
mmetsp:Transcript_23423/g.65566  ORF Transcript_23423/g.65566 Transcript_23423/m.65566 type:complete len:272 (-) Transcript_23423:381-1196(-)